MDAKSRRASALRHGDDGVGVIRRIAKHRDRSRQQGHNDFGGTKIDPAVFTDYRREYRGHKHQRNYGSFLMATKKDVNNIGSGSSYTKNFAKSKRTRAVRTHFLDKGADTAADLNTLSYSGDDSFPGTSLPIMSRSVKKLDGGQAIVTEHYGIVGGSSSPNNPAPSQLLMAVNDVNLTAEWYDNSPLPNLQTGDRGHLLNGVVNTNAMYHKHFACLQLDIPYQLNSSPITRTNVNNLHTINLKKAILRTSTGISMSFSKYTLYWQGFTMRMDADESSKVTYSGMFKFLFRPSRFTKLQRTEKTDEATQQTSEKIVHMLQFPAVNWGDPTPQDGIPS